MSRFTPKSLIPLIAVAIPLIVIALTATLPVPEPISAIVSVAYLRADGSSYPLNSIISASVGGQPVIDGKIYNLIKPTIELPRRFDITTTTSDCLTGYSLSWDNTVQSGQIILHLSPQPCINFTRPSATTTVIQVITNSSDASQPGPAQLWLDASPLAITRWDHGAQWSSPKLGHLPQQIKLFRPPSPETCFQHYHWYEDANISKLVVIDSGINSCQ